MSIVKAIAAVHAARSLDEDERRRRIYAIKTAALIGVIRAVLLRRKFQHKGVVVRITKAEVTEERSLYLEVTFTKPPAEPVSHEITIVNPPVRPRKPSGDEKRDLRQAVREMLEGFV